MGNMIRTNTILFFTNKFNYYLLLILSLIMMNYRSVLVDKIYGKKTQCFGCLKNWVLHTDAWIILTIVVFLVLSFTLKKYILRVIFRALVLSLIAYYLIDIYLFKFLNQRLFLIDIQKYFDVEIFVELFKRDTGSLVLPVFTVFVVLVVMYLFFHINQSFNKLDKIVTAIALLILIGIAVIPIRTDYIHNETIRNFVAINLKSGESIKYSNTKVNQSKQQLLDFESLICDENSQVSGQNKNIILLVVESLSMYQSKLFSGINNWTPNLDKLANEHHYYTNFFANNFTSLEGRLALLTGEKTFKEIMPFYKRGIGRTGYWNSQRNIPSVMKENGYHTSFLDGANLNFTKTGDFMNGIGFDYVEGQEFIGYKDEPRFGFKSVADKVLYNRVINYIKTVDQPFFSTIISVTTHPPYIDPISGQPSIEKATKYADSAIYEFYKKLLEQKYFDNGILIITSDHRSMTPVMAEEMSLFGKQAVARIPLIIIDNDYSGEKTSNEFLQQSDLLNSLQYLISEKHCYRKGEGNIFSTPPKAAQCIYHNRGDSREMIDVYCDEGRQSATVKLYGDDTDIIEGSLTNKQAVIDLINSSRIGAKQRQLEYIKSQKKTQIKAKASK